MKKYLSLFLLASAVFALAGCDEADKDSSENAADTAAVTVVETVSAEDEYIPEYEIGDFEGEVEDYDIDFYLNDYDFSKDFVIDENIALEIGDVVLKRAFGEKEFEKTHFSVCEIKDRDIYVVSRYIPSETELTGDICVAVSKENGAILKVWPTDG